MARILGRARYRRFVASGILLGASIIAGLALHQADSPSISAMEEPTAGAAAASAPTEIPADFGGAFDAGVAFMRQGDPHAAARAFEAARRAEPHRPEAYANLGFAYFEMGQPAAARSVFERAIEIQPMYPSPYYGLAEVHEAEGDIPGAIGAMQTYVHLAAEADPFRRRAMAAVWEWRQTLNDRPQSEPAVPLPEPAILGPTSTQSFLDAPLQTLDGKPVSLGAHSGRFIVLNVWAAWCGPCRMELPSLDPLAASLDPERVAVIGVSIDRERAFTREFVSELGIAFTNYWDGDRTLTGTILDATTLPLTLIIAPGGEILLRYVGARDWSEPDLVQAISDLANEAATLETRVAKLREAIQ